MALSVSLAYQRQILETIFLNAAHQQKASTSGRCYLRLARGTFLQLIGDLLMCPKLSLLKLLGRA